MGVKRILMIVIAIINMQESFSQDNTDEILYDEQTEYIQRFPNRITTRFTYTNTSNPLKINDRNSEYFLNLIPNKEDRIGASITFRALSISYSISPDFLSNNRDNKDSKLFNLGFRTYIGKHMMQSFELYQAKGFYLKDKEQEAYFPKIKSFKVGGATSVVFNENFSFRAIVSQDEKQIKSVGSLIPRVFYYYSKYDIVVEGRSGENDIDSELKSIDIGIAPAYYYHYVPTKNLFISAGVSAGIGLNHSFDNTGTEDLTSLLTELNFRGSVSFDVNNLYLGGHYNYLIINHNTDRSSYVNDQIPLLEFFMGYRFKAPKKLAIKADQFNQKLKI